jgi:hypothetical protein
MDEDLGIEYGRTIYAKSTREKIKEMKERCGSPKQSEEKDKSDLKYKGRLSGFVIVPDEVTYAGENLTHAEFRLWIILRKHAREKDGIRQHAFPGRKRLARMMGIKSLYRISNLIKSLEDKGIIEVERRYLGNPNRYTVKDPPRNWQREMKKELKKMVESEK